MNAIDVDIDDPTSAFWAKSKLDALVPIIEDALASISRGEVPPPNPDLPDNITRDYEEAATIVELSPRGWGIAAPVYSESLHTSRRTEETFE